MKKYQKILALLCIAVFLLTSCGTVLGKTEDVKVTLNGNVLSFDVPPQIINNRTMVPLRAVFEAMGALVNWEPYQKCISVEVYGQCVQLIVGENIMSIYGKNGKKEVWLDSVPCIINGRTLVPVRAISEALGADVRWNDASKTVEIEYQQISHSLLNSGQIEILLRHAHLLYTFDRERIGTVSFAFEFISCATEGKGPLLNGERTEKSVYINGTEYIVVGNREKCNDEYRRSFGCDLPYFTEKDLPEDMVMYNGEYAVTRYGRYSIMFYDIFVYDHTEEKPDGTYDLIFASYPSDWIDYGHNYMYVFNISLADNENGFIMNSYLEYKDGILQELW